MTRHGFVCCDLCGQYLGQLWAQPAIAPDLLAAPDFHVCDDCWLSSELAVVDVAAVLADFRDGLHEHP